MSAPDRALAILFWTCLVVTIALVFDVFLPVVVVPALVVVLALTWRAMPGRLASTRARLVSSLFALAFAAGWILLNLPNASRYVVVDRDPGFLTLAGIRLTDHPTADMRLSPSLLAVLEAVPQLGADSPGYYQSGDILYTQGAKLLPGLLGMVGWVGGNPGVMAGNILVGGFALLSVYALSRRVVGPWWSLLPMVTLGVTVPFAAFTRSGYTEPITLALVFTGLVFVWDGFSRRETWRFALGGAIVGSAALARIDGAVPVIGLVVALGVAGALRLGPRVRRRQMLWFAVGTVGALVMVGLGYLDLRLHSPIYLTDLGAEFRLLMIALTAAVIGCVVIGFGALWQGARRAILRQRRRLAVATGIIVLAVAVFLTSRPLWYEAHRTDPDTGYAEFIESMQRAEGLPVAPTHSYDEFSVTWLVWYLGWPCVVLGFAGLALVGYRAARRRDARYLVLLGVFGVPSLLYLWQVSIAADQIWAMRRFLPITIPAMLVSATIALAFLWTSRRAVVRSVAVALAVVCLAFPLSTWGDLFTGVVHGGRYGQIARICQAVDGRPVIVYDVGSFNAGALPGSIRTICDVEVLVTRMPLTSTQIATANAAWGAEAAVVTYDPSVIPWLDGAAPAPTVTADIANWERTLMRSPSAVTHNLESIWVGRSRSDGTVDPVSPIAVGE